MYKHSRKFLLASGFALAMLPMASALALTPVEQEVLEGRQSSQIWTTYALNPYLRGYDLQVTVHDGKATLTGNVEEDANRELASQIALGVPGVTEVNNQIAVRGDYTPPATSTARAYGESIEDGTITAAVKSKLLWSRHADGLSTNVGTKNGRVTLQGTADSIVARDTAVRLARNTRGVRSVDNQLVVVMVKKGAVVSSVKGTAQEARMDITDGWITTKIKSTFLYSSDVDGSNITVNTNAGVVTLTGSVNSRAERELAIELAQNVRGVKLVRAKGLTL